MSKKISIVGLADKRLIVYSLIAIMEKLNKKVLIITNNYSYRQLDEDMNDIVDLGYIHIHYVAKPVIGMEYGIFCIEDYDFVILDAWDLIYPNSSIINVSNGISKSEKFFSDFIAEEMKKENKNNVFVEDIIYSSNASSFHNKGATCITKKEQYEEYLNLIESCSYDDYSKIIRPYLFVDKELNIALSKIISKIFASDEKKVMSLIKNIIEGGI